VYQALTPGQKQLAKSLELAFVRKRGPVRISQTVIFNIFKIFAREMILVSNNREKKLATRWDKYLVKINLSRVIS
jgi:hypothetical protein